MSHDPITDMPHVAEESAYERYLLHDPTHVLALLRRMVERRCTITVAPADEEAGPRDAVVSALLGVEREVLWVDTPRSEAQLRHLLQFDRLALDGYLDRVHVRFHSGPARLMEYGGYPALRLPVPDGVLHLQRRELMRREPPPGALRCTLPASGDLRPLIDATIRDIGGGGLAVLVPEQAIALQVGDVLRGCRLEVPGAGTIEVHLEICHLREVRQRVGSIQQAGCRFVDLPSVAQSKLFRYLMQLDRERLARR